jgi:hypothetical protein
MERPLIVLVEPSEQMVYLYGEFNRDIPFDELYVLKQFITGRDVLYVSQAEESSGDDVLELVSAIVEQDPPLSSEKKFIRVLKEGYTQIPELKMRFAGPKDAKDLSVLGFDIFDRSSTLRKLLLEGKVEVLSEEKMKKLRKPRPDAKAARDSALDKMILNRKEDALENDEMFNGENDVTEADSDETDEDISIKRLGFGR